MLRRRFRAAAAAAGGGSVLQAARRHTATPSEGGRLAVDLPVAVHVDLLARSGTGTRACIYHSVIIFND